MKKMIEMNKSKYNFELPKEFAMEFSEYIHTYRNFVSERKPKIEHGIYLCTYLIQNLYVCQNYLNTSLYVSLTKNAICNQKDEFQLVLPLLTRVLSDMLCNIVYIFEDSSIRTRWYVKSGLHDIYEDIERDEKIYGKMQPKRLLSRNSAFDNLIKKMHLDKKEINNFCKKDLWPTPPKMVRKNYLKINRLSGDRIELIKFILEYYFKRLSQSAHQTFDGLLLSSVPMLLKNEKEIPTYANEQIIDIITLILAIITEIEIGCNYDEQERMNYYWGFVKSFDCLSEKLFEMRYKDAIRYK